MVPANSLGRGAWRFAWAELLIIYPDSWQIWSLCRVLCLHRFTATDVEHLVGGKLERISRSYSQCWGRRLDTSWVLQMKFCPCWGQQLNPILSFTDPLPPHWFLCSSVLRSRDLSQCLGSGHTAQHKRPRDQFWTPRPNILQLYIIYPSLAPDCALVHTSIFNCKAGGVKAWSLRLTWLCSVCFLVYTAVLMLTLVSAGTVFAV